MANTRALVKRRKAIRNIRKITRTMELIATARFKKALDRATEAEAYTRKIAELAADLSASAGERQASAAGKARDGQEQPAAGAQLQPRPVRRLQRRHPPRGERARSARSASEGIDAAPGTVRQAGHRLLPLPGHRRPSRPTRSSRTSRRFDEVEELANRYIADYIAGKIDRVDVAYMKFLNAARQIAGGRDAAAAVAGRAGAGSAGTAPTAPVEYEFLPERRGHPGGDPAGVVQGSAVQVLPRRRGQRADRPPRGHEGGHRERRRHDQDADAASTTAPARRRSPRRSPRSSAARRR